MPMPQKFFYKVIPTPVGWIKIITNEKKVVRIEFPSKDKRNSKEIPKVLKKCKGQIREYFSGKRKKFDLSDLKLEGTAFQRKVWMAMSKVPYSKTVSYKELAKMAGSRSAFRAVGSACGRNPFPIIIPCHRVVASNGLGGFSSGLWRKKWLLKHENIEKNQ